MGLEGYKGGDLHGLRQADMPPCPRCGEQVTVAKWGFRDSPTVGKLQVYCCRDCNYEFSQFPELPPRENVEPCPHCNSVYHVRKEGTAREKSGERYQKYYCGNAEDGLGEGVHLPAHID